MSAAVIGGIVSGAFVGGQLRWWLRNLLPLLWGTLAANALACLALGLATRFGLDNTAAAVCSAGFAGALSTWSTLAKELGELFKQGRYHGLRYAAVTLACGFTAFALGAHL